MCVFLFSFCQLSEKNGRVFKGYDPIFQDFAVFGVKNDKFILSDLSGVQCFDYHFRPFLPIFAEKMGVIIYKKTCYGPIFQDFAVFGKRLFSKFFGQKYF
jgi:hypothetical protein